MEKILDFITDHFIFFFIVAVAIFIVVVFKLAQQEEKEWERFKKANDCKIVSKEETVRVSNYIQANGQVGVLVTPETKEGWSCIDGITYYR